MQLRPLVKGFSRRRVVQNLISNVSFGTLGCKLEALDPLLLVRKPPFTLFPFPFGPCLSQISPR